VRLIGFLFMSSLAIGAIIALADYRYYHRVHEEYPLHRASLAEQLSGRLKTISISCFATIFADWITYPGAIAASWGCDPGVASGPDSCRGL